MILFESGGIKNLILLILVILFTGIIAWQWIASNPFSNVAEENYFLSQIKEETGDSVDSFQEIKDSVEQGKENLKNTGNELSKQAKQEQLLEEAIQYLKDKETSDLKSPSNQVDCETRSGQWNEDDLKCYVATTDGETECNDSSQCQGYCTVDLSEISEQFILEGQSVETSGKCSENIFKYGCLAIVDEGLVNEIICLD